MIFIIFILLALGLSGYSGRFIKGFSSSHKILFSTNYFFKILEEFKLCEQCRLLWWDTFLNADTVVRGLGELGPKT